MTGETANAVVDRLVDALVPETDRARVRAVLAQQAGPDALRMRSAIVRLFAEGRMPLEQAATLALVNRRDLLTAAGFSEDVESHREWVDRVLDPGAS
ncbi:MAG: hypothetical protein JWM86_2205 [Thermoleophilia bacterium]|nr:hypothetical protein [Thermoleophilia bacterium]